MFFDSVVSSPFLVLLPFIPITILAIIYSMIQEKFAKKDIAKQVLEAGGRDVFVKRRYRLLAPIWAGFVAIFDDVNGEMQKRKVYADFDFWTGRYRGTCRWETPLVDVPPIRILSTKEQIIADQSAEIEYLRRQLAERQ